MTDAVRYEWLRIRTIRSTWWLTGVTATIAIAVSFLIALGISAAFDGGSALQRDETALAAQIVVSQGSAFGEFGAPFLLPYVLGMLGVFTWGHEYRHGMIRATLTALSSRTNSWIAKYLVTGVWVAMTVLVSLTVCAGAGWLWLHDNGISFATAAVWGTILKCVAYTVLFTWVAMSVASLVRNQAGAIVIVLVWPLVIENLVQAVFFIVEPLRDSGDLLRFLPFEAGKAMLSGFDVEVGLFGDPLTPWAGFIVFGAFTAALMGASLILFHKRDA